MINFDTWHLIGNAAQVLLIGLVCWMFYKHFIRGSNSEKFVRGLVGLAVMWIASYLLLEFRINILGLFVRWVALFLSIGLVVVFQPELRKYFGMMGQIKFLRALFSPRAYNVATVTEKLSHTADEIMRSAEVMSAKRTGALIVFQHDAGGIMSDVGTRLKADVSSELMLTIFFNKTPLHDGAIIISGNKILYAGVILPLTENSALSSKYGTRHRAAIGMSEQTSAVVLIISEETGDISIAEHGRIKKYEDMKKLRAKIYDALLATI